MSKLDNIGLKSIGLIGSLLLFISASCQTPLRYWGFNGKDGLTDYMEKAKIDTSTYKSSLDLIPGVYQQGIDLSKNGQTFIVTSALQKRVKDAFSVSFFFKGSSFQFQSFPKPDLLIQIGYPYLLFRTTAIKNGKPVVDNWRINLNGAGPASYSYYTDGNWHQLTFTVDLKTGKKQIFVDGKAVEQFTKDIVKGGTLELSAFDGFRNTHQLDELSFYNSAISEQVVNREYKKFSKGLVSMQSVPAIGTMERSAPRKTIRGYDPDEFAPGYPEYTTQALDQLKSFPDPRFSTTTPLLRNFSWLDITYLHRELPGTGGMGFGKTNPSKAVEMAQELYNRWNYYFDIPVLRSDKAALEKSYGNINTVSGALINHAKANKEIQTSAIIVQVQGNPKHAGFESNVAYVRSQSLDNKYYLKDSKGKIHKRNGRNILSPLAPLDFMYKDAQTTSFYLRTAEQFLGRPINMLNENGEFFGHTIPQSLLESDPAVKSDIKSKGLSNTDYNGWFQNRLDTAYKNEILRTLKWSDTKFTFYNVSEVQPNYWPSYKMRRTSNFRQNGIHYSTPNFYPASPANWRTNNGTYNGYSVVADARQREIELGDKFFAPFVSAGWKDEESNIRPAQWLALNKAMVMLGAEFFHVGYFNITGSKGWPNGKGPYDPRGYIYQAAMPAYAQAIGSRIYSFLSNGYLLNPHKSSSAGNPYAFRLKGSRENHLLMVRKLDNAYIIFGSIQPNSNISGNVPLREPTEFELEGKKLKIEIRKQGSVYYYKPDSKAPVFFQIDGWHQYEHPFYWNTDEVVEAELANNINLNWGNIKTENRNKNPFDLTQTSSYISLNDKDKINFEFNDRQHIYIRARSNRSARLNIDFRDGSSKSVTVDNENWNWYKIENASVKSEPGGQTHITLRTGQPVEIDVIIGSDLNQDEFKSKYSKQL